MQTQQHSHHPGEYRPFGADTVWCPVCDRPVDRTDHPSGYCADHIVTCDDSGHAHGSLLSARVCAAGLTHCQQCGSTSPEDVGHAALREGDGYTACCNELAVYGGCDPSICHHHEDPR